MRDEPPLFLPYRDRIVYALAVVTALGVTPFAVNNFLYGRYTLASLAVTFVAILFLDAYAVYRRRPLPVPLWTLSLPVVATMVIAILTGHYVALAWSYPTLIFFYFILGRRGANGVATMITGSVTVLAYAFIDPALAVRLGATLALTAVLVNIFVGIIADLLRQLAEQAITDPLTGAYNRRQMDVELAELVERSRRGERSASVILVDLDHFKQVNDRHGHAAGDAALKMLVAIVRERVRRIDNVFRSGGEEFVVTLPATQLAGAREVAEAIREAVARHEVLSTLGVTVSAGLAELQPGEDSGAWLKRADEALYEAKGSGRNRVVARAPPLVAA